MNFVNPAFLLLLLVPLFYLFSKYKGIKGVRLSIESALFYSSADLLSKKRTALAKYFYPVSDALICLALIFFIIALARPLGGQAIQRDKNFGIDIVLAIDVSGSMLNVDSLPSNLPHRDFMGKRYYRDIKHELFNINRLNSAKNVIMEYIDKQTFNRIGIVVFAGYSYTKCPLTQDKNMLIQIIKGIDFNPQNDGTAIGMGIATSVNRLKKSEAKSRIIILLTDGINNSGMIDPLSAANIASNLNIRIYTIGLGNPDGFLQPASMDLTDYELQTGAGLDEPILQKIAENTGGKFYRAYDPGSLKKIYDDIDKLEKSRIEIKRRILNKENYLPFLITGFVSLLAYIFMTNLIIKIP